MKAQHKQQSILGLPRVYIAPAILCEAAGSRLVFGGRVTPYCEGSGHIVGYTAICSCVLGRRFLWPSGEQLADGRMHVSIYPTYTEAMSAIRAWQAQHDAAQRASGETPQE